jgi:hypothetical protein
MSTIAPLASTPTFAAPSAASTSSDPVAPQHSSIGKHVGTAVLGGLIGASILGVGTGMAAYAMTNSDVEIAPLFLGAVALGGLFGGMAGWTSVSDADRATLPVTHSPGH